MKRKEMDMVGSPLIFGEVLFDRFDDEAVLGGAPFNVAWHLQGFGLEPLFVSRVGNDRLGERVLERMTQWGMETTGVQTDSGRPTGTVDVRIRDGEPRYDILPEQAYDYIDRTAVCRAVEDRQVSLLYHGTLALRGAASCLSLETVRTCGGPVFVDVNLRDPWWSRHYVRYLLDMATWAKMNGDELLTLVEENKDADVSDAAKGLRRKMGLDGLIVTMGGQGAYLFLEEQTLFAKAAPVDTVVDTVGAGDGFSAVCILGLIRGWEPSLLLQRAAAFASEIVEQRGATKADRAFYQKYRTRWTE